MSDIKRVYLYAELQISAPFTKETVWGEANPAMHTVPGLISKTWLSGINPHTVGGFYEFDSVANARAYAEGMLAGFGKMFDCAVSVKLFDGDVVETASIGMNSPFYKG